MRSRNHNPILMDFISLLDDSELDTAHRLVLAMITAGAPNQEYLWGLLGQIDAEITERISDDAPVMADLHTIFNRTAAAA